MHVNGDGGQARGRRQRDLRTFQAELGVMEAERGGVGGRQQRAPSFPDVEPHRGGDQVRDAPLGARHHVQRPHAPLHGDGHQRLARRRPDAAPRDSSIGGGGGSVDDARSPEATLPDAGQQQQVRMRPGPLSQQVVVSLLPLLLLLLGRAAPVERRPPRCRRPRGLLLLLRVSLLPRPGLVISRRRRRRRKRGGHV